MVPGGITEMVWHFAGYLQIINDSARDRIDYDPSAFRSLQDDYVTPRSSFTSRPEMPHWFPLWKGRKSPTEKMAVN